MQGRRRGRPAPAPVPSGRRARLRARPGCHGRPRRSLFAWPDRLNAWRPGAALGPARAVSALGSVVRSAAVRRLEDEPGEDQAAEERPGHACTSWLFELLCPAMEIEPRWSAQFTVSRRRRIAISFSWTARPFSGAGWWRDRGARGGLAGEMQGIHPSRHGNPTRAPPDYARARARHG